MEQGGANTERFAKIVERHTLFEGMGAFPNLLPIRIGKLDREGIAPGCTLLE
jgi:hypothetical protein